MMALLSALIPYGRDGLETLAADTEVGLAARQAFVKQNETFLPGMTVEKAQRAAKAALSKAMPLVDGTTVVRTTLSDPD